MKLQTINHTENENRHYCLVEGYSKCSSVTEIRKNKHYSYMLINRTSLKITIQPVIFDHLVKSLENAARLIKLRTGMSRDVSNYTCIELTPSNFANSRIQLLNTNNDILATEQKTGIQQRTYCHTCSSQKWRVVAVTQSLFEILKHQSNSSVASINYTSISKNNWLLISNSRCWSDTLLHTSRKYTDINSTKSKWKFLLNWIILGSCSRSCYLSQKQTIWISAAVLSWPFPSDNR